MMDSSSQALRRPWKKDGRGFTLTELLVVMAILSVLTSLLLPAVSKAKASAKTIRCAANLKTAMIGMMLYLDENDGHYPGGQLSGAVETIDVTGGPWKLLIPYIYGPDALNGMVSGKVPKEFVWACMGDTHQTTFSEKGVSYAGVEQWPGSYGYNYSIAWEFLNQPLNPEGFPYVGLALPPEQIGDVVIFSDTVDAPFIYPGVDPADFFPAPANNLRGINDDGYFYDSPLGGLQSRAAERHHGGINVAYGDGHVSWVAKSNIARVRTNWPLL